MRLIVTNVIVGIGLSLLFVSQSALAAEPATSQSTSSVTTRASTEPTTQATTTAVDAVKQMDSCWEDLEKEEPWCSRAILDFYDKPVQSVAFFRDHLKPLKIDEKDLNEALSALASDDDKVWKPAYDKLKYYDPRLNRSVEELMDDVTDPNARIRLAGLLTGSSVDQWKGYEVSYQKNGTWTYLCFSNNGGRRMYNVQEKISDFSRSKQQWIRNDRALVILQHIGTPDAIAVLKTMATGHPAAQSTKIARAALESLGQSDK